MTFFSGKKAFVPVVLLLGIGISAVAQQYVHPSFRIPDSKMPNDYKVKEMADTFRLKPKTVAKIDSTYYQKFIPPVYPSRGDQGYYPR